MKQLILLLISILINFNYVWSSEKPYQFKDVGVDVELNKVLDDEFILTDEQKQYALFIGLGIRIGLNFSTGINTNLDLIKLHIRKKTLVCEIAKSASNLFTTQNQKRLTNFANTLSLGTKIIYAEK